MKLTRSVPCGRTIYPTRILKAVRAPLQIKADQSLYLFDRKNNCNVINAYPISQDVEWVAVKENVFGGDDNPVESSEISQDNWDDVEGRNRDRNSFYTIFINNVSGGLGNGVDKDKIGAIKASSFSDTILSLSETNCDANEARRLATLFGKDCRIKALDDICLLYTSPSPRD